MCRDAHLRPSSAGLAKYSFAIDISTCDWYHRKPDAILEASTQTSCSLTLEDHEAVLAPPDAILSRCAVPPTRRKSADKVARYVSSIAALAYVQALSMEEEDETPSSGIVLHVSRTQSTYYSVEIQGDRLEGSYLG